MPYRYQADGGRVATDLYYDSADPETARNPGPLFRRLRDEAPLYYNDRLDFYALTRYEDVAAGLVDNVSYLSGRGATVAMVKSGFQIPPGTVLFEDPPTHQIHRAMLSRMFTPKSIASIEPQVRTFCAEALDPLVGAGGFDFVADIANQVPMQVIGMLLGIPRDQREAVRDYFAEGSGYGGDGEGAEAEIRLFASELFEDYVEWRSNNPSDDVVTELLHLEFEDEHGTRRTLTRDELLMYVNILAVGGNGTTARLIGIMGQVLAEHPETRQEMRDDYALIPGAIEETMRYQPPPIQTVRYVAQDVEIHDEVVPAGSAMALVIASANRDERRYEDPDTFDIHRKPHHLAFGFGPHYCLGANLTRLETRVVLEEVFNRFPTWEIDTENAVFHSDDALRGWARLPVFTA